MNLTNKILAFFISRPDYFLKNISARYPLSAAQLKKYGNVLHWNLVSANDAINWNTAVIDANTNKLNWDIFTCNAKAFPDLSLLEKYNDLIDWRGRNGCCSNSITENAGLPWDEAFIESVESKIDFYKLSQSTCVKWSECMIDKYIERWDMPSLACNVSFSWSEKLFVKYLNMSYFMYYPFKWNPALISDLGFIEKYKDYVLWSSICANKNLPWSALNLLNKWKDYIDWWGIALNPYFFLNDENFFYSNLNKWYGNNYRNFGALSANAALPWSLDFICSYRAYWNWERLSLNEGLPWSIQLIETYPDKLIWGGKVPASMLDEEGNVISPTGGFRYISGMVQNEALPWSVDFINHFEHEIDFDELADNNGAWKKAFENHVDDGLIDLVIQSSVLPLV
ncbi:MAG TPA: hypothetical protein VJY41_05825 [Prolixibacteraceae bacterium]|nr:hypothetical protein [Prolixibacteraceae bacterium]